MALWQDFRSDMQADADSTSAPKGEENPPRKGADWRGWLARFDPRGAARRLAAGGVDLLYPPQCMACEAGTAKAHALCVTCWSGLALIAPPFCDRLGTPFAVDFGMGMLSPAAIADPPRFDRARAVARHQGTARDLVGRLKYGERLDLARLMGRMMVHAGRDLLADADFIVPVPMHRLRLWRRRYNQAALLADLVARETGIPLLFDGLHRQKRTRAQVGLRRNERQQNLVGAFQVPEHHAARLAGARVVVIDDVRTTGSTLNACAHILRKAGAARIDVLTFTLVAGGEDIS
jgi:ComF family protein